MVLLNVQEEKVKWEAGVKRGKVSSSFPLLNSIFPYFSLTRIHSFDFISRSTVVLSQYYVYYCVLLCPDLPSLVDLVSIPKGFYPNVISHDLKLLSVHQVIYYIIDHEVTLQKLDLCF